MQSIKMIINLILLGFISLITGCTHPQPVNNDFKSSVNKDIKVKEEKVKEEKVKEEKVKEEKVKEEKVKEEKVKEEKVKEESDALLTNKQWPMISDQNVIYFTLDKYKIKSCFIPMLDEHAQFLRSNPSAQVIIEGHADERGTPEYNIALGERRANAVKRYLQSQGVCSEQIKIISYGKEKPAVFGHNKAAYAKNRRTVLVY